MTDSYGLRVQSSVNLGGGVTAQQQDSSDDWLIAHHAASDQLVRRLLQRRALNVTSLERQRSIRKPSPPPCNLTHRQASHRCEGLAAKVRESQCL